MSEMTHADRDEIKIGELKKIVFIDTTTGRVIMGHVPKDKIPDLIQQVWDAIVL